MKPHRTLAALLAWALALAPASADIYPPAGSGAVATGATTFRSLAAVTADRYNILSWGADSTGVADSTTAVQAAYTAACAVPSGQKAVYWPSGKYKTSATITIPCSNVSSIFDGSNTTEISPSSCYGDIFYVGANPISGHQAGNHFVGGVRVFRTDNCTSGAVIHMVAPQLATIEDIEDTGQFGGLFLEQPLAIKVSRFRVDGSNSTSGSYGCLIQNPYFTATTNGTTTISAVPASAFAYIFNGEHIYGTNIPASDTIASFDAIAQTITLANAATGSATGPIGLSVNGGQPADINITAVEFEGNLPHSGNTNGCVIHAADGIYIENGNFGFVAGAALLVQPAVPNESINGVNCRGCVFDSAGTYGVQITDPNGYAAMLEGFNFSNSSYDLNTLDAFYVDASATRLTDVTATGSRFVVNSRSAINLNAGAGFDFSHSVANGSNGANGGYPHVLLAGTATNINLDGMQFLTGVGAHAVPYDVQINSSSVTGVVGRGLISTGSATKDLNFAAVGGYVDLRMASTDRATAAACSGYGSTGTCAFHASVPSNDYRGVVSLAPSGSGILGGGTVTLTMANPAPHAWVCEWKALDLTGTWQIGTAQKQTTVSATGEQIFWWNGASSNLLTSGSAYGLIYSCEPT